jgi:hypothetical protein
MGLVAPFTVEGKVLMRNSFISDKNKIDHKRKWDQPIEHLLCEQWDKFFENLIKLREFEFPRCLKPDDAIGNPMLVIFTDASEMAYGACAYVRWACDGKKQFSAKLIMSKNRIAPRKRMTIPRLELCGAVLGSQLRKFVTTEMDYEFESVVCLTDSTIVRSQIQKESFGFRTFTGMKLGQIQRNSAPQEWLWIPRSVNPADLLTRPTVADADTITYWKEGPDFLKTPFESWPIEAHDIPEEELPDRQTVNMFEAQEEGEEILINLSVIDVERYSCYTKLVKTTAIVLSIAKIQSFKVGNIINDSACFKIAEDTWIRYLQSQLGDKWPLRYRRLGPWKSKESGLIVVGDRLSEMFKTPWNKSELILLPNNRVTYLYVLQTHKEDHTVHATVARVRQKFWIPSLNKMVKKIRKKCTKCRELDAVAIKQKMGSLPIDRLLPSPPFYVTYIDLFGPILIRDTVKGRSRGKAYGVLFNCGTTRAVYIDITDKYDTDSFLLVVRRFVTIHGYPSKFIADHGSQIVAGSKEIKAIVESWDQEKIRKFGLSHGTEWEFTKSADAPWQNGCSESLIRLTKRNIAHSIGTNVLTFNELLTVMFEIAGLLNSRPIGTKPMEDVEDYVCPNDLLMGRASKDVPVGNLDQGQRFLKRLSMCQEIVQQFWKNWQRKYFHTLIIRQRWHTESRNLKIGDIIIIRDHKLPRGQWKFAIVHTATAGKDGRVRDVEVKYKDLRPGVSYCGAPNVIVKRSVHSLILLLPVEEQ